MTNKQNKKKNKSNKQNPQQVAKRNTPFSDAGAIVGSRLGTLFNLPVLKGVGKWLGSGIGSIFGSGDYQLVGSTPQYNVLTGQIPQFDSSRQTNIICHREYIGDITGTAGFTNRQFPLNPGMGTFPWLSSIAPNYQEYKFHGLIFEFRPLITDFVTNGAPGVVIMATNYNADAPPYETKQQMENSEFAVSVKPTLSLIHAVECADNQTILPQRYVRQGAVPTGQDLRLYDLGLFQFASQLNPVQNLGELWVSYCVEFFKPILPADVGGNILSGNAFRTGVTSAAPFGGTTLFQYGDLSLTFSNTSVTFPANPGMEYMFTVEWTGDVAALAQYPTTSVNNGALFNLFEGHTKPFLLAPNAGVSTTSVTLTGGVRCTALAPALVTITFSGTGVYPTVDTGFNILITEVSNEA